jgi:capsular exopolysaccharide synthesis family protein
MLIAALLGFLQTILQKPVYQVSSIIMVKAGEPANSFSSSLTPFDSIGLATNYASEIMSRSAMDFVYQNNPQIKERGYTADDLLANVSTSTSPTASTVSIRAKAANQSDAILLANSVASGFEAYLQTQMQQRLETIRHELQNQIDRYEQDKTQLQKQITTINNNSDPRVAVYQKNIQNDEQNINQLQNQLLQVPAVAIPNVVVIQWATDKDVTRRSDLIFVITGAVGLLVGIAVMLLIIFLDNRVYSEGDVKEKLGFAYLGNLPDDELINPHSAVIFKRLFQKLARIVVSIVISTLPSRLRWRFKFKPWNVESKASLIQAATSSVKRECIDICTTLHLTGIVTGQPHTSHGTVLLVTSVQSTEGKTTVAALLAITLARRGSSVVVVDGSLRQPATHLAFDMSEASSGLGSLLGSTEGETIDDVMQRSTVPGVSLLPVGVPIDDSSFLLDQKFPDVLSQLREKAAWIIIDGPSLLSCVDAGLMASMADSVVLVVDSKHSRLSLLLRAKEILTSLTHKPVGVILNRFSARRYNPYYVATVYPSNTSASSNISVEKLVTAKTEASDEENIDTEETKPALKAVARMNKS